MHSQTRELLAIVKRGEAEEIESARDLVRPELLPELLAAYWTLPTWDDKAGLMQLFSDHFASGGEKVMLDFLTAPITELNDEYTTSGKIVALCQLVGTFEFYERLWYNRPLCAAVIRRALAGEKPSLTLVDALDASALQPEVRPVTPTSQRRSFLDGLSAWQRSIFGAVLLFFGGAAARGLLYLIFANPVRVIVTATVLALGAGVYLLYDAILPAKVRGDPAAARWLMIFCGLFALGLAVWGGFTLFGGEMADGMPASRGRIDLVLPDWASIFAIAILLVLPILLTWATGSWWARSERARQQAAQQEGEVFAIQPLNRWGVLFSAYGMLAIAVLLFLIGRVDGRNLLEQLFVPGIFAAIGIGLLAFFRHTTGFVLLTAERVAVRRLWVRERVLCYAEIESIRPMVFGVPPIMLLRGGGQTLRIPRTAHNLPRLYALLLERAPALRANFAAARRFALPDRGTLFNARERWLMAPQTLVALELSPLELRYQRKGEDWRARSVQDIARIDLETVRSTSRAVSTTPHINLDTHDILVTFRDGGQLRITERNIVQFGTTPEQLHLMLQELYGK